MYSSGGNKKTKTKWSQFFFKSRNISALAVTSHKRKLSFSIIGFFVMDQSDMFSFLG